MFSTVISTDNIWFRTIIAMPGIINEFPCKECGWPYKSKKDLEAHQERGQAICQGRRDNIDAMMEMGKEILALHERLGGSSDIVKRSQMVEELIEINERYRAANDNFKWIHFEDKYSDWNRPSILYRNRVNWYIWHLNKGNSI